MAEASSKRTMPVVLSGEVDDDDSSRPFRVAASQRGEDPTTLESRR